MPVYKIKKAISPPAKKLDMAVHRMKYNLTHKICMKGKKSDELEK